MKQLPSSTLISTLISMDTPDDLDHRYSYLWCIMKFHLPRMVCASPILLSTGLAPNNVSTSLRQFQNLYQLQRTLIFSMSSNHFQRVCLQAQVVQHLHGRCSTW